MALKSKLKNYVARRRSEIGGLLRQARLKKGWTQEQAAQVLECTRVTYVRVELGKAELTFSELEYLATQMGMTLGALLSEGKG